MKNRVARLFCKSALLGVALSVAIGAKAQTPADKVSVNIPAQSLAAALAQLGRDTGTEIAFTPEAVRDKRVAALQGNFDRAAAIKALLGGAGLTSRVSSQGVFVVEPAVRVGATPGSAPRVAQPGAASPPLDALTVEGRRQREETRQQIHAFINTIANPPWDESLAAWQIPICPMVAGLPRDMGEFVLRRVSVAALEADAPLAPEKCHPNFFVIVTPDADALMQGWRRRHPRAFNETRGVGGIKRFVNSPLPIRVWYNVDDGCPGSLTYDIAANSAKNKSFPIPSCSHTGILGTRLGQEIVRVISSVIVVADTDRIKDFNIGQLADYVAMIGMAQINLDKGLGPTPTILGLFSAAAASKPLELTVWDKAYLKSLYNTYPTDVTQVSQMETRMLKYLMQ